MADDRQRCPMCNTKLKMINGRMTCKSCGYYYRNANEQADGGTAQYGSSQQSYSAGQRYGSAGQQYGSAGQQYGSTGQPGSAGQRYGSAKHTGSAGQPYSPAKHTGSGTGWYGSENPDKKHGSKARQFFGILGGIVASVLVYLIAYGLVNGSIDFISDLFYSHDDSHLSNDPANALASSLYSGGGSAPVSESMAASPESTGIPEASASRQRLPESDFFRLVAEAVWDKSYRSITDDEYAQLTFFRLSREEKYIYYQLNDGETLVLTFQSDSGKKLSDLRCFTGLKHLVIDDDLSKGDLDGLDQLVTVYAENSIHDLLEIIPHPENILELSVEDPLFSDSLEGIESFESLRYLSVRYSSLEDISALPSLPDLAGLQLKKCDRLTDYSPLMELTQLEELEIESVQLRSIDFLNVMPNMTYLSIANSMITDLDALAGCPEITLLSLTGNYYIEDYTGLDTLENLTSLKLELNYSDQMPSLQNLGGVTELTLLHANDLSVLRNAPNVTYLCLESCAGWELDAISAMQELTTLEIHGFSSATNSLEPLTRLPKLEALDLSETNVYGSINEIFSIPTLSYLNLSDCRIALNLNNKPGSEYLEYLILDNTSISDADAEGYDGWNYETVPLSDHYDLFDGFPNLTSLSMTSMGIDSIEFVEKLPRLQYLDITDNNVTSLKPLESLPDFRTVWCAGNTLLEKLPEDSVIEVIISDY